jgi:hypothetical protein
MSASSATLSIAATSASTADGTSGCTPFTFTVTRSGNTTIAASAAWTVTGTAADFTGGVLPSGSVSFAAGQTTQTITVNVAANTVFQASQGFTVTLSKPSANATIATASAAGTILPAPLATLSIAAASAAKADGSSGTTPFTFTVTRSGNTTIAASAAWAVTGTAADFTGDVLPSGSVSFAAGQTTQTITVNVAADTVFQASQGFTVTLSKPSANATIAAATGTTSISNISAASANATGTILPATPATLSIAATSASTADGTSGSTPFTFTVTRSGNTTIAASAAWAVTGTAADFTGGVLPSGSVSFAAGQTTQTITVNVAANTVFQASQGFTVSLSKPSANATIGTASATGTILPAPLATLSIAAASASAADGMSGSTPFTFTVTRSGNTTIAASAAWTVTGTAADFTGGVLPSGSVSFAAGQTTQTITVNVAADTVFQASQGFTVTLSKPSANATIATASAAGTILPAAPAALSIAAASAVKADGTSGCTPFTFTVTRSGNTTIAASAAWAITGTAADFTGGVLPSGSVSFAAGQTTQTITVNVAADTVFQASQGFTVTLSKPSANAIIGTAAAAGTILPAPLATLSIAAASAAKADGSSGTTPFTFTVTRSGNASIAASAAWAVTGTAADFTGDVLPSGTVSFAAGQTTQTITVNVVGGTVTGSSQGFTVTLSNPSSGASIGTASASGVIEANTLIAPTMAVPSGAGQVVGLVLQNPGASALAAREITFGQDFAKGQVPSGQGLVAIIGGQAVAVQMDVKTSYADGSVQTALLTLQQPALAAGAADSVMLALAPAAAAPAVNIAQLTDSSYHLAVDLTLHNADGSTTPFDFDAASLLQKALAAGTVSYWQQGPQVTQVRFSTPVTSSMQLVFNVSLYADGTTCTDVQFDNDLAMTASGGTLTYDAAISQNGQTVLNQTGITQYQYQNWDQVVWSNGAPGVNVQQNVAALEATGLMFNYDTSIGVAASTVAKNAANMAAGIGSTGKPTNAYAILGPGDITQYMSQTGGRPDIGPMPTWDVDWLLTQNASAAGFALAQANAAGSVPWHLFNPATGNYLSLTTNPNLWFDGRGGSSGTTGFTQIYYSSSGFPTPYDPASNWTTDTSHQPDLCYDAYLATGDEVYLDDLNAQASFDELATWPVNRDDGQGLVVNGSQQVRAEAWNLRELAEAAAVNPAGSAEKTYFTQMLTNNIQYLLTETTTNTAGAVSGWFTGDGGDPGTTSPWMEDFMVMSLGLAAGMGVAGAAQVLAWASNWTAGRFLNAANGFNPFDGADYRLAINNATTGANYTTWTQVAQATQAYAATGAMTMSSGSSWSSPSYVPLARAALATEITYTGSTQAIQAFGWLCANQQGAADAAYFETDPTYAIAPRLSDGNLLTLSNIFILNDSAAATTTAPGGNADQLIYEQGSANVTLQGGNGINILFGGAGTASLIGGSGNDYLFAGTGATTMYAGAGSNFMQSGCPSDYVAGATTFDLTPADIANDIIAGFRIGTDHLHVAGDAPGSAALATIIAGASADAAGNAVLHLAATHSVTLQGVAVSQVNNALFS